MRIEPIVLAFAFTLHAQTARAEPTAHERASASFEQARAAFARRDFTAAAAAFEQAAQFEPHPAAWLNAAEAWARADDPVRAAADCDRVRDDPGAAASFRDEAETRLKALERQVATVYVHGRTGTAAALDTGTNFSLPARRRMTGGPHVVTVFDGPSPRRFSITAHVGETMVLETGIPPEPPVSPTAPNAMSSTPQTEHAHTPQPEMSRSHAPPLGSWVAFGVSGAALAGAAFFGVRTIGAKSDFSDAPTAATRDAFYRERLYTNVSLGIALGAAATGAVIWILSPPSRRATFEGPRAGAALTF